MNCLPLKSLSLGLAFLLMSCVTAKANVSHRYIEINCDKDSGIFTINSKTGFHNTDTVNGYREFRDIGGAAPPQTIHSCLLGVSQLIRITWQNDANKPTKKEINVFVGDHKKPITMPLIGQGSYDYLTVVSRPGGSGALATLCDRFGKCARILFPDLPATLLPANRPMEMQALPTTAQYEKPSPPGNDIWEQILNLLSAPDGTVDLEHLKDAFHITSDTEHNFKDKENYVYKGVVGQENKLGYILKTPNRSQWSVTLFSLKTINDLENMEVDANASAECVPPRRIEMDLLGLGWRETFGYSHFKTPTEEILSPYATFRKDRAELVVNLTRDGSCFSYLKVSSILQNKAIMGGQK